MRSAVAKKESLPTHRAHVFYGGRVQGVGFRYAAEETAHRIGCLFGFVKNLQDGRVEVVCDSSKEKIDEFLKQMKEGPMGRFITKTDCRWEDPSGEFCDFTVELCF